MIYRRSNPHLGRIVALADFLDTVCRLVRLCYEVRHTDDFVLFVILDHIGLLDYGYEVFGMANLALQPSPDLRNMSSVHHFVNANIESGEYVFCHRIGETRAPT